MARRVEKLIMVHPPDTRASAGAGCDGWVAGRLEEQRCLRTRLLLPHVLEAGDNAKRLRQCTVVGTRGE
jgi:hypothetical protein